MFGLFLKTCNNPISWCFISTLKEIKTFVCVFLYIYTGNLPVGRQPSLPTKLHSVLDEFNVFCDFQCCGDVLLKLTPREKRWFSVCLTPALIAPWNKGLLIRKVTSGGTLLAETDIQHKKYLPQI